MNQSDRNYKERFISACEKDISCRYAKPIDSGFVIVEAIKAFEEYQRIVGKSSDGEPEEEAKLFMQDIHTSR